MLSSPPHPPASSEQWSYRCEWHSWFSRTLQPRKSVYKQPATGLLKGWSVLGLEMRVIRKMRGSRCVRGSHGKDPNAVLSYSAQHGGPWRCNHTQKEFCQQPKGACCTLFPHGGSSCLDFSLGHTEQRTQSHRPEL